MLSLLFSRAWWSAAGRRALRTALVVAAPFAPAIVGGSTAALWAALSTVALAVVLSLATSWASLPEVDGLPRPWWAATLDRTARTFAQALVAGIPAVTLIQDVPWTALLTNALAAAVGSVILAAIAALPESQPVAEPTPVPDVTFAPRADGTWVITNPALDPETLAREVERIKRWTSGKYRA